MTAGPQLLLDRVRDATSDEYFIEAELGRGGMAAVFLARDIALDRRVAIKVMLPDLAGVAGSQDRFVVEARTAAGLDHPGIVTVYAVKQRAGLTFFVMKYVEGETLEHVLATRGALDPSVVETIGSQVAEALHFAHSHGVVHRDVKPSNIMIDLHGRPVVTDFGIAKVSSAPALTMAGTTIGTPGYMSPEQCYGLPVTTASDQYSLGVVLYELLTGRPPFSGALYELLKAHVSDPPPPILAIKPEVHPALEAIILTMLAKNAADRFPSLQDVSQGLRWLASQRGESVDPKAVIPTIAPAPLMSASAESREPSSMPIEAVVPAPPVATNLPPRPPRGRWVAAVVVATALLASVGYAIASRRSGTTAALQSAPPTPAASVDSAARTKHADSIPVVIPETSVTAHADSAKSARADSAAKNAPVAASKPSNPPKTPAPKPGSARDSVGHTRPDSALARCAALNLKFSLGEEVTRADTIFLKQECPKLRPRPPQS